MVPVSKPLIDRRRIRETRKVRIDHFEDVGHAKDLHWWSAQALDQGYPGTLSGYTSEPFLIDHLEQAFEDKQERIVDVEHRNGDWRLLGMERS